MRGPAFTVGEVFAFAWKRIRDRLVASAVLGAISYGFPLAIGGLGRLIPNHGEWSLALAIWAGALLLPALMLTSIVGLAQTRIALMIHDREPFRLSPVLASYRLLVTFSLGRLASGTLMLVGFALCIVPGIVVAVRMALVDYLIVDGRLRPIRAVKRSNALTAGSRWTIFLFGLALLALSAPADVLFFTPWALTRAMSSALSAVASVFHMVGFAFIYRRPLSREKPWAAPATPRI